MYHNRISPIQIRFSPDAAKQFLGRNYTSPIRGQQPENLKFQRGQSDLPAIQQTDMLLPVDRQAANGKTLRYPRRQRSAGQQRSHLLYQFMRAKWLGNKSRSAPGYTTVLLRCNIPRSDKQKHLTTKLLPQASAETPARQAQLRQIQNNQIKLLLHQPLQCLFNIHTFINIITSLAKTFLRQLCTFPFSVQNQNTTAHFFVLVSPFDIHSRNFPLRTILSYNILLYPTL